tara:strand:- start:108 stop:608 length:501 start_codon:yes stop_codon:yes gene_type:complete
MKHNCKLCEAPLDHRSTKGTCTNCKALDDIPAFLDKRQCITMKEVIAKMHHTSERRPSRAASIKMPTARVNPRAQQRQVEARSIPQRGQQKDAVTYPTTEALKAATAHLDNGDKRKANYKIAKENGINPTRWDHLNHGQVAMNLGNTLRGRYYKNQTITIQGKEIA